MNKIQTASITFLKPKQFNRDSRTPLFKSLVKQGFHDGNKIMDNTWYLKFKGVMQRLDFAFELYKSPLIKGNYIVFNFTN